MEDQYQITININGVDHEIIVESIEMANMLLNDPDAAYQYITGEGLDEVSVSNDLPATELSKLTQDDEPSTSARHLKSTIIWSTKKPTEIDAEATKLLLNLREKYSVKFNDRKTSKSQLWNQIAAILNKQFNVGQNGGERCRQKFANLTKSYLAYIKNITKTGEGRHDDEPPFYAEMHSILGDKHKSNPAHLEDSKESQDSAETESSDVEAKKSESRFATVQRKQKPNSKAECFLTELRQDRQTRSEEFEVFQQHLKTAETQRDRFLDILEKAFKRKRGDNSSDSE